MSTDATPLQADFDQFLDHCAYLNRSPQTVRTYRQILQELAAYCAVARCSQRSSPGSAAM